jgi:hypothetical protein
MHAVLQLIVIFKMASRESRPGSQKDETQGVLNWDCKDDEGEHFFLLLQLPPLSADWCMVWHCHAEGGGLNSSM